MIGQWPKYVLIPVKSLDHLDHIPKFGPVYINQNVRETFEPRHENKSRLALPKDHEDILHTLEDELTAMEDVPFRNG